MSETPRPWKDCPCCQGKKTPEHALICIRGEGDEGADLDLRVPWAARADPVGWGEEHEPVHWMHDDDGEDYREGFVMSRGGMGTWVQGSDGELYRREHGTYLNGRRPCPADAEETLAKAVEEMLVVLRKRDMKEGQRWITVHPNGADQKGVPVLIQPAGDGTHVVVGGAGGKLNHLRLSNIKSPEEYRRQAEEKRKERRAAEKERKQSLTNEERKAERQRKASAAAVRNAIEVRRLQAERQLIEHVRDKLGGVDADLDEKKLAKIDHEGAVKKARRLHHKKQLRQAQEQIARVREEVLTEEIQEGKARSAIQAAMQEEPEIADDVRAMAAADLESEQEHKKAMKAERAGKRGRVVAGKTDKAAKAAETVRETIREIEDDKVEEMEERLETLGGSDRQRELDKLDVYQKPSEELERRALQAALEAKRISELADDDDVPEPEVLEALGMDPEEMKGLSPERVQAMLDKEAAHRWRQHERLKARGQHFEELEEVSVEQASAQLAFADAIAGVSQSYTVAKKLGLLDTDHVPMRPAELAEAMDVLGKSAELDMMRREFRAVQKEIERDSNYDLSQRSFNLSQHAVDERVALTIKEEVQRRLTEQLRGMGDTERTSYLGAVGVGHFTGITNMTRGIADQRYIDRDVVDALGAGNAAKLVAWAMQEDGHDKAAMLAAVESVHVKDVEERAQQAFAQANAILGTEGFETVVDSHDSLQASFNALDVDESTIDEAQRALGAAIGHLEATATLAQALREGVPDRLVVQVQNGNVNTALEWLHGLGLRGSEYEIDHENGAIFIPQSTFGRLVFREDDDVAKVRQTVRAIKAGEMDEDGWLPAGFSKRTQDSFNAEPQPRPQLVEPWSVDDMDGLEDHVAARLASGERPADVMRSLLAPEVLKATSDKDELLRRVGELFPLTDEEGNQTRFQQHAEHFDQVVQGWAERRGLEGQTLHTQSVDVDDPGVRESVFRTLTEHPETAVAFKPFQNLSRAERRDLRSELVERMGEPTRVKKDRDDLLDRLTVLGGSIRSGDGELDGMENNPLARDYDKMKRGLIGDFPRHVWQAALEEHKQRPGPGDDEPAYNHRVFREHRELLETLAKRAPTTWPHFVQAHGRAPSAYRALQDELRGRFVEAYQEHHGRLVGAQLQQGVADVWQRQTHIKATGTREERAEVLAQSKSDKAKMQNAKGRVGSHWSSMGGDGSMIDMMRDAKEMKVIGSQLQGGLFGAVSSSGPSVSVMPADAVVERGQRWTLGERAENALGAVVGQVGRGFKRGEPLSIFELSMNGGRVAQQRTIKTLLENGGRLGGFLGTGSGKSAISIGGFTEAKARGMTERGLFLTPSAVQEQFDAEMQRFVEPGAMSWVTGGQLKGHEGRVKALQSGHDMVVMTHESFRATALQVMADYWHDGDGQALLTELEGTPRRKRARMMREAFEDAGIPKFYVYEDEAHLSAHRGGGDKAGRSHVMEMISHPENADIYLGGTATPHSNDSSEAASMAAKIDPDRYGDRADYMRNFGQQMRFNPEAIREDMAHRMYVARIDPPTEKRSVPNPRIVDGKKVAGPQFIPLGEAHQQRYDAVSTAYAAAKRAVDAGDYSDLAPFKALSPDKFKGVPETEHQRLVEQMGPSLAFYRDRAFRRAINQAPPEENTLLRGMLDAVEHDVKNGQWTNYKTGATQQGKPSVIFTNSLAEVAMIRADAERRGLRVASWTGGMTPEEKKKVRQGFNPEGGNEAIYDVLIGTSAMEAGVNLQRGKTIHHYDVPETARAKTQRDGRAHRQGQRGDVDVHHWMADTPYTRRAQMRLERKAALASVFENPTANLAVDGVGHEYRAILAAKHQDADHLTTEAA